VVLAGLAALTVYLHPGLAAPHAHWPLWDVYVYWWGGQQASRGGTPYAPGTRYSFTYPPFAAALFTIAAHAPEGDLAAVITVASTGALTVLCALSLGTAGVRRRAETVFAVTALTPLIFVAYLLITRRVRAAATAAATFAATVAIGVVLLPSQSRVFCLDGVFYDQHRIGNPGSSSTRPARSWLASTRPGPSGGWCPTT